MGSELVSRIAAASDAELDARQRSAEQRRREPAAEQAPVLAGPIGHLPTTTDRCAVGTTSASSRRTARTAIGSATRVRSGRRHRQLPNIPVERCG
jgi:hypothetical protein